MNQDMKAAIQAVITQMMDKVMERVLETRERIYREFLNIEPPVGTLESLL
jgi:hypothetical protein